MKLIKKIGQSLSASAFAFGNFETIFGGTCPDYQCWIAKVWDWAMIAGQRVSLDSNFANLIYTYRVVLLSFPILWIIGTAFVKK